MNSSRYIRGSYDEVKLFDSNYTRMLGAILNKSWRQYSTKHQLYGHLPGIMKTIKVIRTRHAGHCWRSRGELISDVLLWTPSHGRATVGQPIRTYIQQLCEDKQNTAFFFHLKFSFLYAH